jgi:hypothetical protein
MEVSMTDAVLRVSAIALCAAAFISLSPLSTARADTSAEPAPTPSTAAPASSAAAPAAAAPSLSEPAPTPGWAEAPSSGAMAAEHPYVRHYAHRYTRRYAWRNGHRYGDNPVAIAATGVAGGVADLGSLAAYPFYCFPDYGSCPVHWYH